MRSFKLRFEVGTLFFSILSLTVTSFASQPNGTLSPAQVTRTVISDLKKLDRLGITTLVRDENLKVGIAMISPDQEWKLIAESHRNGKCGGFQKLETLQEGQGLIGNLRLLKQKDELFLRTPHQARVFLKNDEIPQLISKANPDLLKQQVQWISSYNSRYHRQSNPNNHVNDMVRKLQGLLSASGMRGSVETIAHNSTQQKTVRLRIEGSQRPDEIIVIGAHFDSIVGWSGSGPAPGADDDASGSANILETARILLEQKKRPERTLEFFWYAGEEGGLLGSKEVAQTYSNQRKDVKAVLQLDMTLFAGNGAFTIGNIGDNTNPWLRDYLKQINDQFLNVSLIDDECGYGCSDHASWHAQGFPALTPFEATMSTMNRSIHTARDKIDSSSNFEHSNVFTKIALIFAWDLGNSNLAPPR